MSESTKGKGKAFFKRGDEVAETGNWDFAIEMYVEGIEREPGNIEQGHQKLRDVALKRKAKGGKNPGMIEQLKRRAGKDPAKNLANASYLWAKDPGSVFFMEQVLQAALALEEVELVKWVGKILMEAQRVSQKPLRRIYVVLTDAFEKINDFGLAVEACRAAVAISKDDANLEDRLNVLSANYTIQKGQYDQEGDFTKGVRDMDAQKDLLQKDSLVKSKSYLEQEVENARKGYEENPTVPGKINGLAEALLKLEKEEYENEAIEVLEKAHKEIGSYQFKMRVGDIKIGQMTRRFRELKQAGKKEEATAVARKQLAFEIEEYKERATNYPTDLALKFELGKRLFLAGQYDDAIATLQQAQRDPRRHLTIMNYLGLAFMKKEWWREAIDTFEKVLSGDIQEERAKDLRYNLGICYSHAEDFAKAQEQFSTIAQVDFNYKDVRQRLDDIRKKLG